MAIVLKSVDSTQRSPGRGGATGLAGFNLDDLAEEGRRQLDTCRRQIATLLEQARCDGEKIRAEARSQGYREGCERAEVDFESKLKSESETRAREQLARLTEACESIRQTYENWMQQYAEVLSATAIAAAERIVQHELDQDRELLVRWAKEALQSTRSARKLTLVVHPETLAELGQLLDELLASPQFSEQTHVEADESVDRNGLIIRQDGGEIHAGLNAQLERLQESLA